MKRVRTVSLAACAALLAAPLFSGAAFGQTTFTLGFNGPTEHTGEPGAVVNGEYIGTLASAGGGAGASGWSISIGSAGVTIDTASFVGTEAEAFFQGGFDQTEVTTGAGNEGAISAVVLTLRPIVAVLPPDTTQGIIKLGVSATIPPGPAPGMGSLEYIEGRRGLGQPVDIIVTQDGVSREPVLGKIDIALVPIIAPETCCNDPINVGFSSAVVSSATPYDSIIDDGSGLCSGGGGVINASGASQHVFANISSNVEGDGASGWSYSIKVDGDVNLAAISTNGTAVTEFSQGGFEQTEIVDPARNNDMRGAISAVVLTLRPIKVVLPSVGTESVLDMTLEPSVPGGTGNVAFFPPGLRGLGQPVDNLVTVAGLSVIPCNLATAEVDVAFGVAPPNNAFIRGNPNDDTKVDIADAIWIVNELFKEGAATTCQDAADVNNDGMVDSSDATYLIAYEFQGGPAPPAPFPDCGTEPIDEDALTCATQQAACP